MQIIKVKSKFLNFRTNKIKMKFFTPWICLINDNRHFENLRVEERFIINKYFYININIFSFSILQKKIIGVLLTYFKNTHYILHFLLILLVNSFLLINNNNNKHK